MTDYNYKIVGQPMSRFYINDVVCKLKAKYPFANKEKIDFEMIEQILYREGYGIIIEPISNMEFEAKTNFITKMVHFREDIYENMDIPRNIFSAVHELGHIQLHTDTMLCLNRASHEYKVKYEGKIYCDIEWQADTFGNLFVVPIQYLIQHRYKAVQEIKDIFGVSEPVATKALKGLNDLITKRMIKV